MLSIKNASKSFIVDNQSLPIIYDITLEVSEGEVVTLLGHSGCGKSTILRSVAGLNTLDSGEITLSGQNIHSDPHNINMVFQDHRLLPWLTVKQNIEIGLDKLPKQQKQKLIEYYLNLMGLTEFKQAYPKQLSGGMAQRVSIARGLITEPKILLLDEPFAALDALTKINLQRELLRIQRKQNITMLMVTHDVEEAIYLSHKVIILSSRPGTVQKQIEIDLPYPRQRSSHQFTYYKKLILNEIFGDSADVLTEEYSI